MPKNKQPDNDDIDTWAVIMDIDATVQEYIDAHPEWETQPSGAAISEISAILNRAYSAASLKTAYERRRIPLDPRRNADPDDVPF